MDLPVQIKFFRKLELYQELKFENKKANEVDTPELKKIWDTEKIILKWTVWNHHKLASPLNHGKVRKDILKEDANNKEKYDTNLTNTFTNLLQRGYAYEPKEKEEPTDIKISSTGLLMGQVIDEVESGNIFKKYKYPLFYYLVWSTIVCGAFLIILNFLHRVFEGSYCPLICITLKNIYNFVSSKISYYYLGLSLNIIGAILIAFAFGKNYDGAYQTNKKGKKKFLASFKHPGLFRVGILAIILGFLFMLFN